MIDAGVEALHARGVSHGLDAIRLDSVIHAAGVPRGAAYSRWDDDGDLSPQQNFRRAVILHILATTPTSKGLERTRQAAYEQLEQHADVMGSGDRTRIDIVMREMIRVVASINFADIEDSQNWRVYRTLASTTLTQPDADPTIVAAVRQGEEDLVAGYAELFEELAAVFHLTLRPGFSMEQFAMSVYALNEGLANRVGAPYAKQDVVIVDPDGSPRAWTLLALGFEAIMDRFFIAGGTM